MSALNDTVAIYREVRVKKDLALVGAFMTGAPQLGSWLSPIKSVDATANGRIEFRAEVGFEHGGHYTVFEAPNHFVLLTDKFGEIDASFSQLGEVTTASLKFSKAGDADYEKMISDAVTRFIAMVNYR